MEELHLGLSEINNMTPKRVYDYVIILSELGKMRKEKMDVI